MDGQQIIKQVFKFVAEMGEQEQSDIIDDEQSGETLFDKVEELLAMDTR